MKPAPLALAAGAAALVAVLVYTLREDPLAIESAAVRRANFEQSIADDGRTRVRDRYVVSAPLAGRLERIALRPGDPVRAGDPVARLSPAAPAFLDARSTQELRERVGATEAQLARVQAEQRRAEAQRDQARADRDRQSRLATEGFVAPAAREQAELALRVAERAAESARFAEDAARHDLAQAKAALVRFGSGGAGGAAWTVASPVTGVVLRVAQESEAVVALGTALLDVGDPRALEAVVDVLSQEAVAVAPGMAARVRAGSAGPALAARVRRVEPAAFTKVSALGVEEQRVNVILDFDAAPGSLPALGDGYRIDAEIVTRRVENALVVPVGALFRDGDGWALYAVEGDRARRRAVKVGGRNNAVAWIESGLDERAVVVVYPSERLQEGVRVRAFATALSR